MKAKALVVYGLGIGCHRETKQAFELAGAEAEFVHFNQLLENPDLIADQQIVNLCGGFHYGDILGSAMCAANLMKTSGLTEKLYDFSESGGVIYGQCNGFQMLVKSGLLPDTLNQQSQEVTLTDNHCGSYRVDFVPHKLASSHFAFAGLEEQLLELWCRHGEGRIQLSSQFNQNVAVTNLEDSVLLYYVNPETLEATEDFPANPNGSSNGIAGLVSKNKRIFGQMAHPEVSIFSTRRPDYFKKKDQLPERDIGYQIFKNIVDYTMQN